jgi:cell division septum initiation protein DivIVA
VALAEENFKLVLRGYDREQVDARLADLLAQLSRARQTSQRNTQEIENLRAEVADLNNRLTYTGKINAAAIVAEADRLSGESARAEAKVEAERMLAEEKAQVESLLAEARAEAQADLEAARAEAAQAKSLLKAELDAMRNRFRDEQSRP